MRSNSNDPDRSPRSRQELLEAIYRRGTYLRRRRRAVLGGAATVVLAVLVAVPALALRDGDGTDDLATGPGPSTTEPFTTTTTSPSTTDPTTTEPPTTPSTTAPTTTTTTAPAPQRPAVAVAVTVDNRLVVVDTSSGAIVRTLYREEIVDGPSGASGSIDSPALSRDGTSVLFTVRKPDCGDRIFRVRIDGGAVEPLAEGSVAAFSPDGRRLAYAALRPNPQVEGWCITVLTVRDLVTGEERSWPPEANGWDDITGVSQISWAPDSRRFVYDQIYENSGTVMLDTALEGTLREASSAVGSGDFEHADPAWMTGERIAVVSYCCYADEDPSATGIDLVTAGERGAGDRLARPEHVPRDLAADDSGRFLIYVQGRGEVVVEGPEDLIDPGGALVLLDLDGTTTTLAGAYREVDW